MVGGLGWGWAGLRWGGELGWGGGLGWVGQITAGSVTEGFGFLACQGDGALQARCRDAPAGRRGEGRRGAGRRGARVEQGGAGPDRVRLVLLPRVLESLAQARHVSE